MNLLDSLFGSEAVGKIFSDENRLQCMLDFEASLASAEARLGIIPQAAASAIASECRTEKLDISELGHAATEAGNLAIPLVQQLTQLVRSAVPDAAKYVHWGATSQDVIDTGSMLQVREGMASILTTVDRLCDLLAVLAERHRSTPMVARTWMQQAIPTVFGFKVAGWLDAMQRHRERIDGLKRNGLALQFGGAAGTLASLGDQGLAVSEGIAEELGLHLPPLPWHAHRDRVSEVGSTLAMCVGTLGKIARDIALGSQTEVGELSEPAKAGRGGSSTMPHKRNPVNTAIVLAAAERVPMLAATLLSSMPQEHERGLGNWLAEWETLPEIFRVTAGALERMALLIEGLEVHTERMLANLEKTQGLIFAEAASMALASHVGKPESHEIVEDACRKAVLARRHLQVVLASDPQVIAILSAEQIEQIFDPRAYLGEASRFIDRVLAAHHAIAPTSGKA
jgi:3-carboxy-cis,cis-muconate cycloisomerase